jgi:hypothetical protein
MRIKLGLLFSFSLLLPIFILTDTLPVSHTANVNRTGIIWRAPSDIHTRNLFWGPGGKEGRPQGPFQFIEEKLDGTNPKFIIKDHKGTQWKVKLGEEAQPETAATRILWAVGYFTDVAYYFPQSQIKGLPKLNRGSQYVLANGIVKGARLEREDKDVEKIDTWSWHQNPFLGTKEFNGLRVMMALLNNWDLKEGNNAIYKIPGQPLRYLVSDLGATFGKTGGQMTRSKGDIEDYLKSPFIAEANRGEVDMVLKNRPSPFFVLAVPYYIERTKMENIGADIPRQHARWIGQWLARLSDQQIKDAFRAAGYAPQEAKAFSYKVRERIKQLNRL